MKKSINSNGQEIYTSSLVSYANILKTLFLCACMTVGYSLQAQVITPDSFGSFRDQNSTLGTIESGDGFFTNFVTVSNFTSAFGVEDRSVIEFDMSTLGSSVNSAFLNLVLTKNDGDPIEALTYDVYSFAGDGTVGLSNPSDFNAGTFANSFTITNESVGSVISLDMTSQINALLANGDPYAAFNIRFNGAEPDVNRFTWLSGFNDGTNIPTLSFSAVPEPSTYAAIALSVLGIGIALRRRKAG